MTIVNRSKTLLAIGCLLTLCALTSAQTQTKLGRPAPPKHVGRSAPLRRSLPNPKSQELKQDRSEVSQANKTEQAQLGQAVMRLRAQLHQEEMTWRHTHPKGTPAELAAERSMLKGKYEQGLATLKAQHRRNDSSIKKKYLP